MSREGVDFLVGGVFDKIDKAKKNGRKLAPEGIEVTHEEIQSVLDDTLGSGRALHAGLKGVVSQLEAIKKVGLTGEALVLLVTEKCGRSGGNRVTATTVQVVLEALFNRLSEYIVEPKR